MFESGKIGFDKENKLHVPIQYCVIQRLVDYLPLEDLKSFEVVDITTHWYASQSGFYRFVLGWEKPNNETWRHAFFGRMSRDYDYRLKVAYCYAFGFPSDFFIQQSGMPKNEPKRCYYSKIPSLNHLYNIVHLEDLYRTINEFDVFFNESQRNKIYFSLANAFYIVKRQQYNSLTEQKQHFKYLTQEYSDSFRLLYEKRGHKLLHCISVELQEVDFRMDKLQRYYITLVLALPGLLGISVPAYKHYLYKMILELPFLYKQTAFIMLYGQYRKPIYQMDDLDKEYCKTIFTYFNDLYQYTQKMGFFSSRFFSYYLSDFVGLVDWKQYGTPITKYVQSLLRSGLSHPESRERVLLSLTRHIFENEQIKIDGQQYEIFDGYAVHGLQFASPWCEWVMWWFSYFRKILFFRYCLDTNQNKLQRDFIDTEFQVAILYHMSEKCREIYWRLWQGCIKKYPARFS